MKLLWRVKKTNKLEGHTKLGH